MSSTRVTLSGLLVVGLWWHCSAPVWAEATKLKAETPSTDTSKPVDKPVQMAPPVHEILYGGARKSQERVDPNAVPTAPPSTLDAGATTNAPATPLNAGATIGAPQNPIPLHAEDNIAALQAQDAKTDAYQLAVQKLSHGFKLTADEFRALGVGIVGYESDEGLFGKANRVTTVYKGSPAEAAGIHAGDKEVWSGEEKEQPKMVTHYLSISIKPERQRIALSFVTGSRSHSRLHG